MSQEALEELPSLLEINKRRQLLERRGRRRGVVTGW